MARADIPAVRKLMEQLDDIFESGHDISLNAISSTFALMKKNDTFYKNYVAVLDHTIVGFVSIIFYKTFFHTGGTALINELIVDKTQRGKGIGKKLVEKARNLAEEMKMNEIEVSTSFDNTKAISFYKSNGLKDESILLGEELNE